MELQEEERGTYLVQVRVFFPPSFLSECAIEEGFYYFWVFSNCNGENDPFHLYL